MLRIRLSQAARERGYFAFKVRSGGYEFKWLAPAAGSAPLLARWAQPGLEIVVEASDGRLEPPGLAARLIASLRLSFTSLKGGVLRYGDVELFPVGGRLATRRFRKHVKAARRHDSPWDGAWLQRRRELIEGWPRAPAIAPQRGQEKIAVALHLYYTELWPELETLLGRWRRPFALFVTLSRPDAALKGRIEAAFPGARVRVVENQGRDVRPFLIWLEEGAFDRFELLCKIHGKRALSGGRLPAFGDVLRRVNFHDLMADDATVERLVARFAAAPQLGLIGSARFLSATANGPRGDVLGPNRANVESLARRMGAPLPAGPGFDFFEGTMFWVRPEALAPLRALRLSVDGFAAEAGSVDGGMEHAVERLINHIVRHAGRRVESTRSD